MRKALLISAAVLAVSSFVLAGGNGAVKTPVWDGGSEVGWAILNTDCEGFLVVNVHLDDGLADEEFTVRLNGEVIGSLETNRKGKGNFYAELALPEDVGETIDARVTLVATIPGDRPAVVRYRTDRVSVPVKGPCDEEMPE
jgi:hypothetical protein